jgi:hypothetical protein
VGKRRWQAGVGVTGGVRAVGKDVLSGTVLGVGSRQSEERWSGLSAVAQFSWRGTAVVERRSNRGRRQGGWGSSQRRCGARGGDGEFGGGPRWHFMVAQQRQHDGTTATMGGGGKGQRTERGAPFKCCMRRWPRAAETVGGTAGRSGRRSHGRTRQRPWSEPGWHGSAILRTVWLMGGPTRFYIFSNYPNWLQFGN